MSDSVLALGDRQEGLSRADVLGGAAAAGYTLAEQDFDRDGVDVQVRSGGAMRPSLDMQLEGAVRLVQDGAHWRFSLPKRNHDLLREPTMAPRVLVVLDLPAAEERWLSASAQELVMRRCAYWVAITSGRVATPCLRARVPCSARFGVPPYEESSSSCESGTGWLSARAHGPSLRFGGKACSNRRRRRVRSFSCRSSWIGFVV